MDPVTFVVLAALLLRFLGVRVSAVTCLFCIVVLKLVLWLNHWSRQRREEEQALPVSRQEESHDWWNEWEEIPQEPRNQAGKGR